MSEQIQDHELIEAYLRGDEGAFTTLYNHYKPCLFAYLNRLLQNDYATADDLFQQLWLKIIPSLQDYVHKEKFLSWALRIAHNLVIDYYRSKRVRFEVTVDNFDYMSGELEAESNSMDYESCAAQLDEALDVLSPSQREVVILRREGIPFKEIADIQGVQLNTAIGRMHDAIRNLQKYIEKNK